MDAAQWDDPHDILPVPFRERYSDCDTAEQALRRAERAPSSTPEDSQRQCKVCGSRRVRKKIKRREMEHRRPEKFVCTTCGEHQNDPITPNDPDTMHGTATTDDRVPFDWTTAHDLEDPDERAPLTVFGKLDEESRTEVAIRLYQPWSDGGPSYRELAKLFPDSRWWIGERIREWKRGEHRDLVEQPSPTVDAAPGGTTAVADGGTEKSRWSAYGGD